VDVDFLVNVLKVFHQDDPLKMEDNVLVVVVVELLDVHLLIQHLWLMHWICM
jgi:hypothetical protein